VLETWKGDPANVEAAQKALLHRAELNSKAMPGQYTSDMEKAA
jgi:fructose-bisphosphate aldolase class I